MLDIQELVKFVNFLLGKTYQGDEIAVESDVIAKAFEECCADARYHAPQTSEDDVFKGLACSSNALPVFLYRLGNNCLKNNCDDKFLGAFHWLLRECCACEIYFNNEIGVGFKVVHGVGSIVGSRNRIGKGFTIYQGCTIGHKESGGPGNQIGDNVTLYAGSMILGDNRIGNNVVIGANSLVISDIPDHTTCAGSPVSIRTNPA